MDNLFLYDLLVISEIQKRGWGVIDAIEWMKARNKTKDGLYLPEPYYIRKKINYER